MRNFSGFSGILYGIAEWTMRFSTVNILWFIVNIPIIIVISSVFLNGFEKGFAVYLMPLAIFIPALFVPSTIAMFATVREWILQKEQPSITKTFLAHMKDGYKKSFLAGLVLMLIWFVWGIDFYFFQAQGNIMALVFLIIGLMLFVYTINFFSLSAHFKMTSTALLKNAFFITAGNPLLSVFILGSNLALFYVSTAKLLFLFPFFTGSLSAYLSFIAFYRFTLKTGKKAEMDNSGGWNGLASRQGAITKLAASDANPRKGE